MSNKIKIGRNNKNNRVFNTKNTTSEFTSNNPKLFYVSNLLAYQITERIMLILSVSKSDPENVIINMLKNKRTSIFEDTEAAIKFAAWDYDLTLPEEFFKVKPQWSMIVSITLTNLFNKHIINDAQGNKVFEEVGKI